MRTTDVSGTSMQRTGAVLNATRRQPGPGTAWAGAGLVSAGWVLGIAVVLTGPVRSGELALDELLARHRDLVGDSLAESFGILFGPVMGLVLLGGACVLVWLRDRVAAVQLAFLTLAGWASVLVVKAVLHRARPQASVVHALLRETGRDGFPSGHTALAAAAVVAAAVVLWSRRRPVGALVTMGALLTTVVAVSRLYLGVHYAADVLAAPLLAGGMVLLLSPLVVSPRGAAVVDRALGGIVTLHRSGER